MAHSPCSSMVKTTLGICWSTALISGAIMVIWKLSGDAGSYVPQISIRWIIWQILRFRVKFLIYVHMAGPMKAFDMVLALWGHCCGLTWSVDQDEKSDQLKWKEWYVVPFWCWLTCHLPLLPSTSTHLHKLRCGPLFQAQRQVCSKSIVSLLLFHEMTSRLPVIASPRTEHGLPFHASIGTSCKVSCSARINGNHRFLETGVHIRP